MQRTLQRATEHLSGRGKRMTVQRRAVLQALIALGCARSAEEIHAEARQLYPRVGLVTVYRTLEVLARQELVHTINLGDGRVRYDLAEDKRHHHHLVCVSCGTVERLGSCTIRSLERTASGRGFRVTAHRLELFGYCPRCRAAHRPRKAVGTA